MSRSIGDLVAASVGVSCEPEFYEMELTDDDKFIIIASDGVWEFIHNEDVIYILLYNTYYRLSILWYRSGCRITLKEHVRR